VKEKRKKSVSMGGTPASDGVNSGFSGTVLRLREEVKQLESLRLQQE
jgi:hypothetical protein